MTTRSIDTRLAVLSLMRRTALVFAAALPLMLPPIFPMTAEGNNASPPNPTLPAEVGAPSNATIPVKLDHLQLGLEDVISLALERNRDIRTFRENLRSSELSLESEESDFKYEITPTANIGLLGGDEITDSRNYRAGVVLRQRFKEGTRVEVGPFAERTDESGEDREYVSGMGISLTQPLLRGLGRDYNLNAVKEARFGVRKARRALYLKRVDVILEATGAAYAVMRRKLLLDTARASAERLEEFARLAKEHAAAGKADPVDVLRAQTQLRKAQNDIITNTEALELALDDLKLALDLPLSATVAVDAPMIVSPFDVSVDAAVDAAGENRVEIEESEDFLRERYRLSGIRKHELLPKLDVNLRYSRTGTDKELQDSMTFDSDAWSLGANVSADIFRRRDKSAYRQSLVDVDSARIALELARDSVASEVRREFRKLQRSLSQITLQTERTREAQSQRSLARSNFLEGRTGNFDLIDAELSATEAQSDLIDARVEYILAQYRFRAAVGTLLERQTEQGKRK
ncbi:outer membrane protein TolC [Desulfobaculum xiamenense]|uniref:Outer membrane protein TolC n=1 Tax=Desulfobaculum xiamenense TaxID=995050 RepID=A0A846QMQ7_9BACT|nr:TolC family protein [Desulfobaculum xiamenense]NJB67752.1 outer membrane protein TolC [Desulfobaculum xiamenense]